MESRFGTDFSDVRVRTDAGLEQAAETEGTDIRLSPGVGNLGTSIGQRVMAHELAHVVQQRRGGTEKPRLDGQGALETDARAAAETAVTGSGHIPVNGASAVAPAAYSWDEFLNDADGLVDQGKSYATATINDAVEEYVPESVRETVNDVGDAVGGFADQANAFVDQHVSQDVQDIASEFSVFDPAGPAKAAVKKYAPDVRKFVEGQLDDYENSSVPASVSNPFIGPVLDAIDPFTDGAASRQFRKVQSGLGRAGYSMVEGVALAAADPEATLEGLVNLADMAGPVHRSDFTNLGQLGLDLLDSDVDALDAFSNYGAAEQKAEADRNKAMQDLVLSEKGIFSETVKAYNQGEYSRAGGAFVGEFGSFFVGGGASKTGTLSKTAKTANAVSKTSKTASVVNKFKGFLGFGDDVGQASKLGKADDLGAAGKLDDVGAAGKLDEAADVSKLDDASDASKLEDAADVSKLDEVADAEKLADVIPINRSFIDSLPQVLDDAGNLILEMFDQPKMAANGGPVAGPRPVARGPKAAGGRPKSRAANDVAPRRKPPKPRGKTQQPSKRKPKGPEVPDSIGKDVDQAFDAMQEPAGKPIVQNAPDKVIEIDTRLPGVKDPSASAKATKAQQAAELGLTPTQLARADDLLGKPLSGVFDGAWDRALARSPAAQKKMAEVKKLLDEAETLSGKGKTKAAEKATKKAKKLAAKAYGDVQPKYWKEVYADPANVKALEDAGFSIEKVVKDGKSVPKGTAPSLKDVKGKKQKITLEHADRKSDVPMRAVDPENLLLSLSRENSVYLEAIRRAMRWRMQSLGLVDFKDWSR